MTTVNQKSLRSIFAAAALTLVAWNAQAQDTNLSCAKWADAAKKIMWLRQDGFSMPEMIEMTEQSRPLLLMVEAAYLVPRYHSESSKQRATEDFHEEIFKACRASGTKQKGGLK